MLTKDVLGNVVETNEQYYKLPNGAVIHVDALEDFVIEVLGATVEVNTQK